MNGIELKTVNPVVLDDPEFCQTKENFCCGYLDQRPATPSKIHLCNLFLDSQLFSKRLTEKNSLPIKCADCKDHYQRNKP